ncbi:MAG: ribonuclease HII [Inquilinaceae bacterium]
MPDLSFEYAAGAPDRLVAGVDEVGRGPLAGPVVAAAAILPRRGLPPDLSSRIDDSKALSAALRTLLAPLIRARCQIAIGRASVAEIDRLNILRASHLAMERAVAALTDRPALALVDGNRLPSALCCPGRALIGGDRLSLSIAAAAIVAKVERDREMAELALRYPGYGWERNAGYGTRQHLDALNRLGPTPLHRCSFAPVARRLGLQGAPPGKR